jgi:hypothetical protein
MHELRGRLSLLDPTAGDALKVIEYFDRLVASQVSIETLVRGAATGPPPGSWTRGLITLRLTA